MTRATSLLAAAWLLTSCVSVGGSPAARSGASARLETDAKKQTEEVDLLRATRTDVGVSSVYRNRSSQALLLVDGDLETAWNSRSGDLVGAWIEIRVPAGATVSALALTVGYTHVGARADLFTGNHRIARVRVSRDGAALGEHDLDTSSRELQRIPVTGGGGVYRIEVLRVEAGSRASWRELCVSELRVFGRAPGMTPGARFPRVGAGSLPELRPEPGSVDAATLRRQARRAVAAFLRSWQPFAAEQRGVAATSAAPRLATDVPLATFRTTRRTALGRIADLTDLADERRADALRQVAAQQGEWGTYLRSGWMGAMHQDDLTTVDAAMQSVLDRVGQDTLRCLWARAHARLRFDAVAWWLESNDYHIEMEWDGPDSTPEFRRSVRAERGLWLRWQEITARWPSQMTTIGRRLARFPVPESAQAHPDFAVLRAQLAAAEATCAR